MISCPEDFSEARSTQKCCLYQRNKEGILNFYESITVKAEKIIVTMKLTLKNVFIMGFLNPFAYDFIAKVI